MNFAGINKILIDVSNSYLIPKETINVTTPNPINNNVSSPPSLKKRKANVLSPETKVTTPTKRILNFPNFDNLKKTLEKANSSTTENWIDFQANSFSLQNELEQIQNHSGMQSNFSDFAECFALILIPNLKHDEFYNCLESFFLPRLLNNEELRLCILTLLWNELQLHEEVLHSVRSIANPEFRTVNNAVRIKLLSLIGAIIFTQSNDKKWKDCLFESPILCELLKSSLWLPMIQNTKVPNESETKHLAEKESNIHALDQQFFILILEMPLGRNLLQDILSDEKSSAPHMYKILKVLANLTERLDSSSSDQATRKSLIHSIGKTLPQSEAFFDRIFDDSDDYLRILRLLPESEIPTLPKVFLDPSANSRLNLVLYLQSIGIQLSKLHCWEIVLSTTESGGLYKFYQSLSKEQQKEIVQKVKSKDHWFNFAVLLTSECTSQEFMEIYTTLTEEQRKTLLSWHLGGFNLGNERYCDFDDSIFLRKENGKVNAYSKEGMQLQSDTVVDFREFTQYHEAYHRTVLFLTKAALPPHADGNCMASSDALQQDIANHLSHESLDDILLMFTSTNFSNDRANSFFNLLFINMDNENLKKFVGIVYDRVLIMHNAVNTITLNEIQVYRHQIRRCDGDLRKLNKDRINIERLISRSTVDKLDTEDYSDDEDYEKACNSFEQSKIKDLERFHADLKRINEAIEYSVSVKNTALIECQELGLLAMNINRHQSHLNQLQLLYQILFNASAETARKFLAATESYPVYEVLDNEVEPVVQKTITCKQLVLKTLTDFLLASVPKVKPKVHGTDPLLQFQHYEKVEHGFLQKLSGETRDSLVALLKTYPRFQAFCYWREVHYAKSASQQQYIGAVSNYVGHILTPHTPTRILFTDLDPGLLKVYNEFSTYFISSPEMKSALIEKLKSSPIKGVQCFSAWLEKRAGYNFEK